MLPNTASQVTIWVTVPGATQERMIKRGGGRACNFRRFLQWQNNPQIPFIEQRTRENQCLVHML